MSVLLTNLVLEWVARLLRLRTELSSSERDGQDWVRKLRVRILAFLLSRYESVAAVEREPRTPGRVEVERPCFCRVLPEDRPPRRREDMGVLLQRISRHNVAPRPRRRWFL